MSPIENYPLHLFMHVYPLPLDGGTRIRGEENGGRPFRAIKTGVGGVQIPRSEYVGSETLGSESAGRVRGGKYLDGVRNRDDDVADDDNDNDDEDDVE